MPLYPPAGGAGGITEITSTGDTIAITDSTGPTTNLEASGASGTAGLSECPQDYDLLGWHQVPFLSAVEAFEPEGSLTLGLLKCVKSGSLASFLVFCGYTDPSLINAESGIAIYSAPPQSGGTSTAELLGQSTAGALAAAWTENTYVEVASEAPVDVVAGTFYYVAFLIVGEHSTSMLGVSPVSNQSPFYSYYYEPGAGLSAFPASIDVPWPSSFSITPWAGLVPA
jgi:hypothetical protein